VSPALRREYQLFRQRAGVQVSDGLIMAGLSAWATLFGAISFEVFGHLRNVIDDRDTHFVSMMKSIGTRLIEPR
jgi:Tetracyclin repressor-like, C-terminal domain